MSLETVIELSSWILMSVFLLVFVSRDKVREAQVIFLFHQMITWLCGFAVVEMKWIEYPVRFFDYAARTSFTFEYFVCPALAVLFTLYYPNHQNLIKRLSYSSIFVSIITVFEVLLERYTNLIQYHEWTWYWSWMSILAAFYLTRKYYFWFFNLNKVMDKSKTTSNKPQ